jgi:hypothetical protein
MAQLRSKTAGQAPSLVIAVGSLAIAFHLGAVIVHALAAPSGPWPNGDGPPMAGPPAFAQSLDESLFAAYLKPLKLTHNYHFAGNRPIVPGVFIDIKLKNAQGEVLNTIRWPDPAANSWLRYMQGLFVQGMVPDQPVAPPQGEEVPAPHQQPRMASIWEGDGSLRLTRVPEHLIPRNRPVYSPTDWSLILVHSCARYLCRTHGAASAEVIRYSREAISPAFLSMGPPPPMAFADLIASYGDISSE